MILELETPANAAPEQPKQHICPFCGRPINGARSNTPKGGRKKAAHYNCKIILSLMRQLDARCKKVMWQSPHYIKRFRGDLFSMQNGLFNQKDRVVFAPDDDSDPEQMEQDNKTLKTLENEVIGMLEAIGLWPEEAAQVVEISKTSPRLDSLRGKWDKIHAKPVIVTTYTHTLPVAKAFLEANEPDHFALRHLREILTK